MGRLAHIVDHRGRKQRPTDRGGDSTLGTFQFTRQTQYAVATPDRTPLFIFRDVSGGAELHAQATRIAFPGVHCE
jgi:hypothetical protein